MYRTRVGYTGGKSLSPTYHKMGDHTESLQIDFDPAQISLTDLVGLFWRSHTPASPPRSAQYRTTIWYANDQQREAINAAKQELASRATGPIQTPVLPRDSFYRAEDYHQKYGLQRRSRIMAIFREIYPDFTDFVDSTAAARLNGDRLDRAANLSDEELESFGVLGDEIKKSGASVWRA